MADLKISALPASTTPLAGTEVLPIVQSATTRQVSVANLTAGRAVSALSLTSTNDATINGITVGRGGGSVNLNTAVGASALAATSTGDGNAAFGASALASNLAGTGNTATGFASLRDNTSGNYNVASGYLALATNLSGANNVGIGYSVLSTATATSNNTAIGYEALKVTSGSTNTAIGYQSGIAMTTGTKNVILGSYSGNTGTLDIRISNNNIVLSDGDGNVRAWWDNANARFYGTLLATGITNSALTSGRVTFASTGGLLTDSANLTFSGTALAVTGLISTSVGATTTNALNINAASAGYGSVITYQNGGVTKYTEGLNVFTGTGEWGVYDNTAALIRLYLSSTGNLGIGTSNPSALLGIATTTMNSQIVLGVSSSNAAYGSISLNGSSADNGRLGFTGGGTGDNTLYIDVPTSGAYGFRLGGTNVMTINSSGIVTMGAYGAGAATFSASGVISSVSDETWKTKDGVPNNPDLMLQKLDPGYWFYNEEKAPIFGEDRQLGFYAQNVHEAIGAEAAPTPEEGKPWGYYDRSVLAVAVMSLKNALNTIEELKQRITVLENK